MIEEIKKGKPDIICLQGCDQFDYFQEKLTPRGFIGIYERTTKPLQMQNVYFGDGLAIFWRTEKFELSGRQKFLLGDNRFISNIALLARLKRRSPFIDPTNMDFLRNPQNIVYESYIKCKSICGDNNVWCVLSTKFLYLFAEKQHYENAIKYFDLDTFYQIKNSNSNLNDTSFVLYSKKDDKQSMLEFETNDINKNLMWIKHIRTQQIGTELDVWNTHLIEGHSVKCEYRRVKQVQVLFECMARASAQNNLIDKNIGSKYNPYSTGNNSQNTNQYKFYQDVLDSKAKMGRKHTDLSILSKGIGGASPSASKRSNKSKKDSDGGDLAERFKKMMEKRIQKSETAKLPVRIDPNIKDNDKASDDEKKEEQEEEEEDDRPKLSLDPIVSSKKKPILPIGGHNNGMNNGKDNDDPPFQVPTQLHRPVILCADTESNAHGDYMYQIPPLSYTYLTLKSRTTQNTQLYEYSIKQLQSDPALQTDRHSWFLQSAYALGFGSEPELTSFNRYWPHEATDTQTNGLGINNNNLLQQTKKIDFMKSIEIAKCSDVILFSPQHFRVLKLLQPLRRDWILNKWNKTLPNIDYPSDHSMIGVEFELAIPVQVGAINMSMNMGNNMNMPIHQQLHHPSPGLVPQTPTTPTTVTTPGGGGNQGPASTPTPSTKSATGINIGASMATSALPTVHYTPTGSNNPYNSPFANQYNARAHFQHK